MAEKNLQKRRCVSFINDLRKMEKHEEISIDLVLELRPIACMRDKGLQRVFLRDPNPFMRVSEKTTEKAEQLVDERDRGLNLLTSSTSLESTTSRPWRSFEMKYF